MSTAKINNSLPLNRTTSIIKSGGTSTKATTVSLPKPDSFIGDGETINTALVTAGADGLKYAALPSGVGTPSAERKLIEQNVADVIPGGNGLNTSIQVTEPTITASGITQDIHGRWKDSSGNDLVSPPASTKTYKRVNNVAPSGDRDSVDAESYAGDYHYRMGARQIKELIATSGSITQNS